jgi:hypothetical protein
LTLKLDEPNIVTPHGFSDSALKYGDRVQHLELKCGFIGVKFLKLG